MEAFHFFRPVYTPIPLIRIGGSGDGAYVIPDDLDGINACFSPGVNNYKAFEDQLVSEYGIKVHMCDFTSDPDQFMTPLISGMQTFEKKWLDINSSENCISLDQWVDMYSPFDEGDLILQIDIEGAEYRNLLGCSDSVLRRFRIIIIELHSLNCRKNTQYFQENIDPLCKRLRKTHAVVHAHANNCCGDYVDPDTGMNIPSALELTLLRLDRIDPPPNQGSILLPNPLDICRNVQDKPPIFLNEKWLNESRGDKINSSKIIGDYEDYYRYDSIRKAIHENTFRCHDLCALSSQQSYRQMGALVCKNNIEIEVADGKSYVLSSGYQAYPSAGTVHEAEPFFFHTDIGTGQKITIDLEDIHRLVRLEIRNRIDGWWDRAACLFVSISESAEFHNAIFLAVPSTQAFVQGEELTVSVWLGGTPGRFVSIESPSETALHFSAVRVYAQHPAP